MVAEWNSGKDEENYSAFVTGKRDNPFKVKNLCRNNIYLNSPHPNPSSFLTTNRRRVCVLFFCTKNANALYVRSQVLLRPPLPQRPESNDTHSFINFSICSPFVSCTLIKYMPCAKSETSIRTLSSFVS